jgi:hypothetical protein
MVPGDVALRDLPRLNVKRPMDFLHKLMESLQTTPPPVAGSPPSPVDKQPSDR